MSKTWKQKKEIVSEFIKEFYADTLLKKGFVSYQDAGFNWYKVKNGMLYTVRILVDSPHTPMHIEIGLGVIPLFSWEYIIYTTPMRDWGMEFFTGCDHYLPAVCRVSYELEKSILGSLPRASWKDYFYTQYAYDYKGATIEHWISSEERIDERTKEEYERVLNSYHETLDFLAQERLYGKIFYGYLNQSRRGVEVFDEIVFPVQEKLDSIQEVYEANKLFKLLNNESEYSEESYLKDHNPLHIWKNISLTFADQCLFCGDEKWYPVVLEFLRQYKDFTHDPMDPSRPRTKKDLADFEATKEHARVLIRVIETGDRELLRQELIRNRERMERHIREKLPDLSWENIEPDPLDEKVFR